MQVLHLSQICGLFVNTRLLICTSKPDTIILIRYFNGVQSECFREAYLSDENMVVSAPTGSGKTGIFELCILRLLSKSLTPTGQFNHPGGSQKIVRFNRPNIKPGLLPVSCR